jgi:hypothetical protein
MSAKRPRRLSTEALRHKPGLLGITTPTRNGIGR